VELQHTTAQEIERAQEEEAEEEVEMEEVEAEEIETENTEAEEEAGEGRQPSPEKGERQDQESDIMEGAEHTSSEGAKKARPETTEEMFIPQEVRDPMGKLKKDFFETPPDEIRPK
jgi:vacuolar-type H+-ATPase subunit E/Vma4